MKVLVVGAGIGGLCAALALARRGYVVETLERAEALVEVGVGLQISPNAVVALRALGVEAALTAVGSEPQALELRLGRSGRRIFSIPMGPAASARYGAPYLHVHRADLLELLRAAANNAGASLRLGADAVGVEQAGHGVRVKLASGDFLDADLVIGADGLHSVVRRVLLGDDSPRFTGAVAWRGTAPASAAPDLPPAAIVWVGHGRHAVTYRIRNGERINFVGVIAADRPTRESWEGTGDLGELQNAFAGWAPPLGAIIAGLDAARRWPLFDRDPLPRWTEGRVGLLGDACHPMPPFQAQGAGMAIEDAYVLAACLAEQPNAPEAALKRYETLRRPRAAKVLMSARSNQRVFHQTTRLGQLLTYGPMRLADWAAPGIVRSRQDWIYGFDATRGWAKLS